MRDPGSFQGVLSGVNVDPREYGGERQIMKSRQLFVGALVMLTLGFTWLAYFMYETFGPGVGWPVAVVGLVFSGLGLTILQRWPTVKSRTVVAFGVTVLSALFCLHQLADNLYRDGVHQRYAEEKRVWKMKWDVACDPRLNGIQVEFGWNKSMHDYRVSGQVQSLEDLERLKDLADKHGLYVHSKINFDVEVIQ